MTEESTQADLAIPGYVHDLATALISSHHREARALGHRAAVELLRGRLMSKTVIDALEVAAEAVADLAGYSYGGWRDRMETAVGGERPHWQWRRDQLAASLREVRDAVRPAADSDLLLDRPAGRTYTTRADQMREEQERLPGALRTWMQGRHDTDGQFRRAGADLLYASRQYLGELEQLARGLDPGPIADRKYGGADDMRREVRLLEANVQHLQSPGGMLSVVPNLRWQLEVNMRAVEALAAAAQRVAATDPLTERQQRSVSDRQIPAAERPVRGTGHVPPDQAGTALQPAPPAPQVPVASSELGRTLPR